MEDCGACLTVDFGFTERRARSARSGVKPKSTGKLAEQFSTHGELAKFRRRRHNRSGYERSEAKQPGTVDPMDLAGFGMFLGLDLTRFCRIGTVLRNCFYYSLGRFVFSSFGFPRCI